METDDGDDYWNREMKPWLYENRQSRITPSNDALFRSLARTSQALIDRGIKITVIISSGEQLAASESEALAVADNIIIS